MKGIRNSLKKSILYIMVFTMVFGVTEDVNIEKVYAASSEVNIIYKDDKGNTLDSVSTTTETTLTTTTAEELYAKNIQGYSYVSNTITSSSASSSGLSCNYDSSSGRTSIFTSYISHNTGSSSVGTEYDYAEGFYTDVFNPQDASYLSYSISIMKMLQGSNIYQSAGNISVWIVENNGSQAGTKHYVVNNLPYEYSSLVNSGIATIIYYANSYTFRASISQKLKLSDYGLASDCTSATLRMYSTRNAHLRDWGDNRWYSTRCCDDMFAILSSASISKPATYTVNMTYKANTYYVDYSKGLTNNGGTTNKTTHTYDEDVTLASNGFTGMSYSINFDANKPSNATGEVQNMPSNLSGNLQFDKWSVSETNNSGEYSANTNLGVKNFESTNEATAHATALWKKSYYYEKKQPTLKDYEFVGWSTDKNATSGDLIAAEDILPSTSAFNKTLYAIWKPVEYKITYSANGATNVPSTQTKKADTSIKLSSLVPEREFYRFIEWNTNADGTGTTYQPNQTYSTNADLTLYAIFDYNKDDIYYYKGLTNDTTHTDIIKATRNSNIQSNSLITQPYTQWVMNNNIPIAGIGTVKGREYKVNFDYNIPVSATNEQKDTVIISGYTNDASGKTTYKVNDYLKFNKWSLTGSKLLPPTIEPEQTYKPVYRKHVHSGSSSTGGGCYTIRKQRTDSYTTTCGCASCWCEGFNGISDNWNCVHCGHGHNGPHGDGNGTGNGRCTATKRKYYTVVYYELGCGKTEGVRYQDEGIDYYAIDANPNYTGPFGTEATNKIATALWKNVTFGNFKTPTMDGWNFMGWYDNQAGNNSTAVSTVLKTKDTDYYTNKINTTTDKSANSNVKVYGDLTEYTVEPSTGIFEKTLYARWQRTITLTFNMNNGQYQGSSDDVVLTGVYYNNADGYNFSLTSVPTAASLPDYEKQQNYIDAYGVYNSNGENSKYTYYNELTETTYRFLGWSLDPNATEPDSDLIVFDSGHKTSYRIYDDTTLYAVWEPVLITNLTLKRTLGNLSFSDGTLPNGEANNIRCSDGQQLVEVIAKPGEQCYYTITTKGKNGINAGVRFDNEILNIYANDGIWKDNLNPNTGTGEEQLTYCGLDRNFTITESYLMRKFYIPQYLGTENSYPSSKGKTQYQVIFEIAQSSYFYNYVYHKNEQVEVVGTIYITTQAPGGGGGIITPTPNPPIISVLDELRTKLKIRLH